MCRVVQKYDFEKIRDKQMLLAWFLRPIFRNDQLNAIQALYCVDIDFKVKFLVYTATKPLQKLLEFLAVAQQNRFNIEGGII